MKYQHARRLPRNRVVAKNRKELNDRSTRTEHLFAITLDELSIKYVQNYTVRTAESFAGYYLIDFYLPEHKLLVEIDGGVHRSETRQWKDRLRTEAILRAKPKLKLVRLWNSEVESDPYATIAKIIST